MTLDDYREERRYIYNERLALLGFFDAPPDWAHNMAVLEADAHVAALKREERKGALSGLLAFRDAL
jgi:hypothetical protein